MHVLRDVVLVAYGLLAVAASVQYRRRRQRPAAYLAAAFGILALTLVVGRVTEVLSGPPQRLLQVATVAGLLGFPWLLAAFAWSFDGPLPPRLRRSWAVVAAVAAVFVAADPGPETMAVGDVVFLATFLVAWLVPSVATARRLWRAGGSTSRVVRSRMRLLAGSLILLTAGLVLVIFAAPRGELPVLTVVVNAVSLVAAGLALAAFAPPLPLRLWWRRQGAHDFQRMQQRLISAVTPQEAARAVAPILARHMGAGVAVASAHHELLAIADLDTEVAQDALRRMQADEPPPADTQVVALSNAMLIVHMTAYSPFFGDYERELAAAYGWQLQLALERSELAARHLEALEQVERTTRDLEAMLLGLSHDLRSPAVAIGGYTMLLREARTEDERGPLLDGIAASSTYLNGLVDALLELSRIGRSQTDTEPVDLASVARVVRERVAVTHPGAVVEVGDDLPVVRMNPVRAEQLVDNLVSNAVKHGGRRDVHVRVSGRDDASVLELVVADDGRGIRVEDRERIFDLFQRGRETRAPGSGVGLGMVRRIAEHYGGSVRLAEVGAEGGAGATFVVRLPVPLLGRSAAVPGRPGPLPGAPRPDG